MTCTHGTAFRDGYGCEMCAIERSYRVIGKSARRRMKPKAPPLVEQEGDAYYARALARSCAQAHVKKLRCAD